MATKSKQAHLFRTISGTNFKLLTRPALSLCKSSVKYAARGSIFSSRYVPHKFRSGIYKANYVLIGVALPRWDIILQIHFSA